MLCTEAPPEDSSVTLAECALGQQCKLDNVGFAVCLHAGERERKHCSRLTLVTVHYSNQTDASNVSAITMSAGAASTRNEPFKLNRPVDIGNYIRIGLKQVRYFMMS